MRSVARPPTTAGIVAQVEADKERLDAPSRRRTVRVALVATLVGVVAFLLVQGLLAAYNLGVVRDAVDRGLLHVSELDRLSYAARLSPVLFAGGISFLILALVGSAVASRGHRVLFALPAAAYILVSVFAAAHHPEAIGVEWSLDCYSTDLACGTPWFGHPWFGPIVDLALVLVPGWAVGRSVHPRRWPGRTDAAAVASILVALGGVAVAGWTIVAMEPYTDLRTIVPVGVLGLALGVARPWWPWLHVLFAAFAFGWLGWLINLVIWPDPGYPFVDALPYLLEQSWPIAAVGLIGSAWQPLARAIRKLQERPFRLAIAVNALNVVDAVMTYMAVRSGSAFETNPVVRVIGLPAKIVLVGLLTWLLYRRKPSVLVWPFAALLCVTCYHVAGIFVNGWH
jgi:hypothetical protein